LTGAAVLVCSGHASAEALGSVAVAGNCPDQELVKEALGRRELPAQAGGYALVVRGAPGSAEVSLANAAGELVAGRRLESDDCRALADAAALIVETYFVELKARTEAAGSVSEAPGESANDGQKQPPVTAPPTSAPPPPAPPAGVPRLVRPRAPSPPAATTPLGVLVALAGGLDWLPEHGAWSGLGEAVVGLSLPRSKLGLELYAVTGTPATIGNGSNRVSRLERRLALRVDRPFRAEPTLAPWLGAGVAVARLQALDLDSAPTPVRWSPTVEAGVTLSEPVAKAWALRAELGCRLLVIEESYRVSQATIGSGPRVGCDLLGGLSWSSGSP